MLDVGEGFRVGERLFRWGVGLTEVAASLGLPFQDRAARGWRRFEMPCGPTYGFDMIGAELTAYGPSRPVTALAYEIAAIPGDPLPEPAKWVDPLARTLGRPGSAANYDLPGYADPADGVRYYANWPGEDHSVGLSLYGAPRTVKHGLSAGCLWLNWAIVPAAAPFLGAWRARVAELDAMAATHSGIVTFHVAWPAASDEPDAKSEAERLEYDSDHALGQPQILPTPASIGRQLGSRGIGFWRSADHRRWCASTRNESIVLPLGSAVKVDWYDIQPAKGGGFSEINIDGWSVRDVCGSSAIKDAIAALATIPGVTINHLEGYDC